MSRNIPMSSGPTAQDVARLSGVSQMTVSRAFGQPDRVSVRTRERVFQAARRLGYQPNLMARGLRGAPTRSIGVVWLYRTTTGDETIGLEIMRRFQRRGYATYSAHIPSSLDEYCQVLDDLARRGLEALVVQRSFSWLSEPRVLQRLARFPSLVTFAPEQTAGLHGDLIVIDRLAAIEQVAKHFAATGRREPVMFCSDHPSSQAKVARFTNRGNQLGLHVGQASVVYVPPPGPDPTLVAQAAAVIEDRLRDRPETDAVFCTADDYALIACRVLERLGRRVPDDVSVVGFNNQLACLYARPSLSSVDRCINQVTDEIERLVLRRIENPEAERVTLYIPMQLIVRESSDPSAASPLFPQPNDAATDTSTRSGS